MILFLDKKEKFFLYSCIKKYIMENYQELAEDILAEAIRKGADEADIFLTIDKSLNFLIEKDTVESSNGHEESGVGIRVVKDHRIGFSYTTNLKDRKNLEKTIDKAIELSKLSTVNKNFSLPSSKPIVKNIPKTYDKKIAEIEPKECLELVSQLMDAVYRVDDDIVTSGGGINLGENITVIANTNNIYVTEKSTFISMSAATLLKKREVTSGFEIMESRTIENIDPSIVGENAANLAKNMQNSRRIRDGKVDVIFMPYALISLIEVTLIPALYADKAHKNATIFSNKINEKVVDEKLSIFDDPLLEGGLNSSITDDELIPSKKTILIENGELKTYLYDQKTACMYNMDSTSNGVRIGGFKSLPRVAARNIVIDAKEKLDKDKLIEEIKDGILLYDVLGAHTSDPASGNFSVASSILFRIKNGEIAYPVKKAMISGNILEILRKDVELSKEYKMLSGSMSSISTYIPILKAGKIKITS
jgi:PmbA protein